MNYIRYVGVLVLALINTAVWAQTVSGTVTDENNQLLPGATIVVQGTNTGTTSDFDGNYQIRARQGQTIVFSYVGYATQSVVVNSTTLDVSLQADNTLDEVVVTALGITRKQKSLGYSVQTVSGESVEDVRSVNPIEALQGEVAGLDIQSFNTMGGSANVVIRGYSSLSGSNQALFVVDGTPIDNETVTKENILSERRKELMFEGFRWDDLMRTGSSIEIYGGLMNLLETLTYPNNLFAHPIPLSELNANSNMIQNSGY